MKTNLACYYTLRKILRKTLTLMTFFFDCASYNKKYNINESTTKNKLLKIFINLVNISNTNYQQSSHLKVKEKKDKDKLLLLRSNILPALGDSCVESCSRIFSTSSG